MQAHPHHDFVLNHAIILKENDLFGLLLLFKFGKRQEQAKE